MADDQEIVRASAIDAGKQEIAIARKGLTKTDASMVREVEALGAKVLVQYATLGRYDFVTVVEAPSEEVMARVSAELGSRGTMSSETLTAMPSERLEEIL